ncbi:hypothetical protein GALL_492120 [mine drainage metagenome]|uniref:Uncharacterized protein n=1 Tax=mine drainage metagenome TaxID=410659 RepID=A0A1J5PZY7_9ZZZZ
MKTSHKIVLYAALLGLLLLVFALYGRPEFMLSLATQLWGCF